MTRLAIVRAVCVALLVLPADLLAQGGMLGRVKARVNKEIDERTADRARPAADSSAKGKGRASQAARIEAAKRRESNPYQGDVLEITPEIAARIDRGFAAAVKVRKEQDAARGRPYEEYAQCLGREAPKPEYQRLLNAYIAAAEAGRADEADRLKADMAAWQLAKCGADPRAAARGGWESRAARTRAALAASGFTEAQFAMFVERIVPFCRAPAEATVDGVKLPGRGNDVHWIYSPGEAGAMRPRCAAWTAGVAAMEG